MQKKINQILEGNFDYESGSLDFSCSKIELSLKKGEVYEGSFRIFAPQERFCSGNIISSDLRMEVITEEFIGSEEEIYFRFHGEKAEEGDVVKGSFYIVSNQGEYYLPFVVSVEHRILTSSVGPIRNLFHFANLAKSNWQEALNLFYSADFSTVFDGTDSASRDVYRALSVYPGNEQNMEEFLMQANKKQKMGYLLQEERLSFEVTRHRLSEKPPCREIIIIKNGWGYNRLTVECVGDCITVDKEVLTDADFVGNRCAVSVYVDVARCRSGITYCDIRIYNAYTAITVPVVIKCDDGNLLNSQILTKKRIIVQLMELYCATRSKKLSTSGLIKEAEKLIQKLVASDENDAFSRLLQAQLLITEGNINEAGWVLDHIADLLERDGRDETLWAYYLYLTSLVHREPEYIKQVTEDVERIYRKNVSNWRVAWLLLYLSEEYNRSASARWLLFATLFETGCTSPAIYLEAVALLNNNPSLLQQLGTYELQVIWYGVRHELLKPETVEYFLSMLEQIRGYSEVVYQCLSRLYDVHEDIRILQEICGLLIREGKISEKYVRWYRLGIEKKLRITNLYEYYILSLNLQEKCILSKELLIYFSYQCNLDYERTAYLYSYVLQNEEKLGDILELYKPRIESFSIDQVKKRHINRHLGYIYGRILQADMITEEMNHPLSYLIYAHGLQVSDNRLRKVYVYQNGNRVPEEYPVSEGKTWISLYGSDYIIVFEDANGNRYVKNVDYTLEKLTVSGRLMRMLDISKVENPQLEFFLCRGDGESDIKNPAEAELSYKLINSDYMEDAIRQKLSIRLLQYYYDNGFEAEMEKYLDFVVTEALPSDVKNEIVRYMLLCNRYDLAENWIQEYGPYFLDSKHLIRLLGVLLENSNMVENPVYVAAALSAFQRGKYDATILNYLMTYYKGLTKVMRDIWKAAKAFELDCYVLDERLLVQMLYSGAFVGEKMEIFRDYLSQGAKLDIEYAFLTQCAAEYFTRYLMTDTIVFDELLRLYLRGEKVQTVCKLALIKYYAENQQEMTLQIEEVLKEFIHSLLDEDIYLECFRCYKKDERVMQEMSDKTIIEYTTKPNTKVCIHYVISHESGDGEEYASEYMREVYRGVYMKKFILFFGECLQYYITEEENGEEHLTESSVLQRNDIFEPGSESRYSLINDIVISKALEDFDTMENLLDEYYRRDFLSSRLFETK